MAGTAVVVLTLDAAAGRGLLIYLCSTADRLEEAAFRIFFQPFSIAQTAPFMGQPFPTRTPEMQHRFKSVLHFRLPSAPQRYNTLDFPTENRVPRWTLSPLDTPAKGQRCFPLDTSRIFCDREYPNCKNAVRIPLLENEKPLQFLSCAGMKIVAALLFCRTNISAGRH